MAVSAVTTGVPDSDTASPIWTPAPDRVADAAITRFAAEVSARTGRSFGSYADLWAWSVGHLEQFWATHPPQPYRAGEWGPKAADEMLARDGRTWRRP